MSLFSCLSRGIRHNVFLARQLSIDVTKEKVLSLRQKTGLGLGKCRAALMDKNGDVDAAAGFLKEEAVRHGWERMEKLSGRDSSQGLVGVIHSDDNRSVSIVEVTCETDFVRRNDLFVDLVHSATQAFHRHTRSSATPATNMSVAKFGFDSIRDMQLGNGRALGDHLAEAVGVIGENVVIRAGTSITSPLLASYVHSVSVPARDSCQFGHICVVADLEMAAERAYGVEEKAVARQLCQHLLALNPTNFGLDLSSRPYDSAQLQEAQKKILEESCILDESRTVGQLLVDGGMQLGGFVRVNLAGEAEAQ